MKRFFRRKPTEPPADPESPLKAEKGLGKELQAVKGFFKRRPTDPPAEREAQPEPREERERDLLAEMELPFSPFSETSENVIRMVDRKAKYKEATPILEDLIGLMEKNRERIEKGRKLYSLVYHYSYLGRCYFMTGRLRDSVETYLKGIALKTRNAVTCEFGLDAVLDKLADDAAAEGREVHREDYAYLDDEHFEMLHKRWKKASEKKN